MTSNPFDVFKDDNFDSAAIGGAEMISVAQAKAGKEYIETCPKCRGSGAWRPGYPCFSCKGKGRKSYKTDAATRAGNRASAAQRKVDATVAWCAEHKAEVDWCAIAAKRNAERGGTFTFPQSMLDAIAKYGSLTDGQLAAVRKLMARDAERTEQRKQAAANAPVVDVSKIEAAFATARERAKRPNQAGVFVRELKLRANGIDVFIKPGSVGSQWEGMLFARNGDGLKLGHIKNSKFTRKFDCTDADQEALLAAASNPGDAAVAFGKAYGICAVCSRTLLNDGSIERGIGPICAERFGW